MEARLRRIERWITPRNARLALGVLLLLTTAFGAALREARLDHDFERFFPTNDPELDRYLAFRERFGGDDDFLLIGAAHEPSVFDSAFLARFDALAGDLIALPHVRSVNTLTRAQEPRLTPVGAFLVPWLRWEADSLLRADSIRVWSDALMREAHIAADGKAMLMVLRAAPGLSKDRSDSLFLAVQAAVDRSGLSEVRMGGRIHGQYWYIQKMQRELVLFFSISVALLSVFLAIGFRTWWGVAVPLVVVGLSVLWQVGLMTLMGKPLTVLTMLLPTILFVVGMSDVVHILQRYIDALRSGHSKARALAITYYEVGLATFLTSLTTAIGFATLMSSGIQPIREFGVFTGIGVFVAFTLAFTLLPALLLSLPTPVQAAASAEASTWFWPLHRLFRQVVRRRRLVIVGSALLMLGCLPLASMLKVDNHLLEDWPDDDPQKQDYFWFEQHFGGVRPFEMEVIAPGGDAWSLADLRDMDHVENYLRNAYGVGSVMSPSVVIKAMNKAANGGDASYFKLPDNEAEARRLVRMARLALGPQALSSLVDSTGAFARVAGRLPDEGGHVFKQRNAALDTFLIEQGLSDRMAQTGMAFLIDRNNEKLSSQLIAGLSLAFLLIAAIMAWVFRDARMTLVALLPNVLPLLMVAALMGAAGIAVKVSTAIIFTIAFGIAVDDTIHVLGKLRIELLKGRSVPLALKRSVLSSGKAVLITSIMLCSGFVSLVFSSFASVHYMGLLVSCTLAFALAADLLLLPPLVLWLIRRRPGA
ncbi:MAG: MMPL family transporter [Flavobacteriales bacterium]|nr:MMPL family transporter [Flavobacteriales bacterium]